MSTNKKSLIGNSTKFFSIGKRYIQKRNNGKDLASTFGVALLSLFVIGGVAVASEAVSNNESEHFEFNETASLEDVREEARTHESETSELTEDSDTSVNQEQHEATEGDQPAVEFHNGTAERQQIRTEVDVTIRTNSDVEPTVTINDEPVAEDDDYEYQQPSVQSDAGNTSFNISINNSGGENSRNRSRIDIDADSTIDEDRNEDVRYRFRD